MSRRTNRNRVRIRAGLFLLFSSLVIIPAMMAKDKKHLSPIEQQLSEYQHAVSEMQAPPPSSVGSLWAPWGTLTNIAADYKARNVNDLITIRIVEQTTAAQQHSVKSERTLAASSSLSVLGHSPPALKNIFSPNSSQALNGQGQTASSATLQTSLSGRVLQVLPSGVLLIEATREIEMNNERQLIAVRGLVRPGDIAPDNSVVSTAVTNLEVRLRGKGVVSDGVRPPNVIVRAILRLVGF